MNMNISDEFSEALPYVAFWGFLAVAVYGLTEIGVAGIEAKANESYPIINCQDNKSPYYIEHKYGDIRKEWGCK